MARNVESTASTGWSSGQAYALALVCLAIGLVIGYLFRGSESQAPAVISSAQSQQAGGGGAAMPGPGTIPGSMPSAQSQMTPEMLQQAAQPFLNAVKQNPNDTDALTKLGNLYYDAQQYPKAIDYYGQVLAKDPNNVNVRTDMGTAIWYMGDPDRALSEFAKSLAISPNHPQTLFNVGIVKWQGKKDPKGAVAAWEQLLKNNPNYPERSTVETYIAQAKQHASR